MKTYDLPVAKKRLSDLIRKLVARFSDVDVVAAKVHDQLRKDDDWSAALLDPMVRDGIHAAIYQGRHAQRNLIKAGSVLITDVIEKYGEDPPAKGFVGEFKGDVKIVAKVHEALNVGFLSSWYIQNKPLGDCTKAELEREAAEEKAMGDGHYVNVRLYKRIAARLKAASDTVSSVWKDDEARSVLAEVIREGSDAA